MSRLTRRGEAVVLAGVTVALAVVVYSAHAASWVRAWGLAGAAVFGLLFVAAVAATLLVELGRAAARLAAAARIRWHRWRFTREAYTEAIDRLRAREKRIADPCPPTLAVRVTSAIAAEQLDRAVDELARRRMNR